jgi:hypothetical protein
MRYTQTHYQIKGKRLEFSRISTSTKISTKQPRTNFMKTIASRLLLAGLVLGALSSCNAEAQPARGKQSAATRAKAAAATPIDVAINKAERLVMLSQRTAKLYAQGSIGISPIRTDAMLQEAISQFESELGWMKANLPSPLLANGIRDQETAWLALKSEVTQKPTRDKIEQIASLSEALYNKSKATALGVESLTADPLDEIVGVSGKQGVLIQRMGKLYMFDHAGHKGAKQLFKETKAEFLANHKKLSSAKETTEPIKRELELILGQANLLLAGLVESKVGGEQNDALVGKSIEVMLQMQESVTTMFERL